jgi:D-alanine-D-alanine ligase
MKIAVLAGGLSPERDVSLSSGSLIANALEQKGHLVAFADVYVGIDPSLIPSMFRSDRTYTFTVSEKAPDIAAVRASCGNRESLIGPGIIELCLAADAVFIALHGGMGENGQIQAALDCAGVKHYTGTNYTGALLSMDKDIAKQMMSARGVPVPSGIYFDTKKDSPQTVTDRVGLPCVIKPASGGSSVGVSRVYTREELESAILDAASYERFLLAEELIEGRELTCAVLAGEALPPIEIIPKHGWYDYRNKYQSGLTTEICPAPLSVEETAEIQRLAVLAFNSLRMSMYGRADFILDRNGKFYCLEVNSLPGMTPTSLMPQAAAAAGIPYADLCDLLVRMAMEK